MAYVRRKKGINVSRVVGKVAGTLIALYVGGTIVAQVGSTMNNTYSPFYTGLRLIGWTVGAGQNNVSHWDACTGADPVSYTLTTDPGITTCISDTSGAGILAVVGIIGIASIVMEFVELKF